MHDLQPGLQAQLAARLRRETKGEVLFSRADRGRYATDASIYQVEPVGVIVPRTIEDVAAAMAIARESGVPVLPRGGGTSQCGQTVNRALVIDCSKYLRNVLEIDPDRRRAVVEPGVVLGHLNAALKPHGLFFPVDPSTHARCTIGGMAGNNSCGSKSIRYGLMADNVARDRRDPRRRHAAPLRSRLARTRARRRRRHRRADPRLRALGQDLAPEIAARFPQSAAPGRRLQHRRADAGRGRGRAGQSGAAAGRLGRHARLLRRARAHAASDQAAQSAGHLPVPDVPRRDGGGAPSSSRSIPRRWNWSIAR